MRISKFAIGVTNTSRHLTLLHSLACVLQISNKDYAVFPPGSQGALNIFKSLNYTRPVLGTHITKKAWIVVYDDKVERKGKALVSNKFIPLTKSVSNDMIKRGLTEDEKRCGNLKRIFKTYLVDQETPGSEYQKECFEHIHSYCRDFLGGEGFSLITDDVEAVVVVKGLAGGRY